MTSSTPFFSRWFVTSATFFTVPVQVAVDDSAIENILEISASIFYQQEEATQYKIYEKLSQVHYSTLPHYCYRVI